MSANVGIEEKFNMLNDYERKYKLTEEAKKNLDKIREDLVKLRDKERKNNGVENKEGGYNKDEHRITEPSEVLKRSKELNKLKEKRNQFSKDSPAYRNLETQINKFESNRITDDNGNTIGWKKFDNEK